MGDDEFARHLAEVFSTFGQCTALEIAGTTVSYSELWKDAATVHQQLGESDGRPVLISRTKDRTFYSALLACLAHGRSFSLLDPDAPPTTQTSVERALGGFSLKAEGAVHELGSCRLRSVQEGQRIDRDFHRLPTPRYYIATSGTTGTPRLVEVEHRSLLAFVDWAVPFYDVDPTTRWAQFSGIGFDLTLVDVITCWSGGGVLVPTIHRVDRMRPGRFVERHRITHWHSVPSMIPSLLSSGDLSSVEVFTFCGEPLLRHACDRLASRVPGVRVVNTYGPTEGTLFCTYHEVGPSDLALDAPPTVPIGQAIPGWELEVTPTRDGYGELFVQGPNIALGYLGLEDTGFSVVVGHGWRGRRYATGDFVRTDGGNLYFSHRRDRQVKVRGVRVELAEIEHALGSCGFPSSAAVAHEDRIHAVVEHDQAIDVRGLMLELGGLLPASVLPSSIRAFRTLPRTSSGKIDRSALLKEITG